LLATSVPPRGTREAGVSGAFCLLKRPNREFLLLMSQSPRKLYRRASAPGCQTGCCYAEVGDRDVREEVLRDRVNAVGRDLVAGKGLPRVGHGIIGQGIINHRKTAEIAAEEGLGGIGAALNDASRCLNSSKLP